MGFGLEKNILEPAARGKILTHSPRGYYHSFFNLTAGLSCAVFHP